MSLLPRKFGDCRPVLPHHEASCVMCFGVVVCARRNWVGQRLETGEGALVGGSGAICVKREERRLEG
jgi:hypothetical protein